MNRRIKIKNIESGFVIIFKTKQEASWYLDCSLNHVKVILRGWYKNLLVNNLYQLTYEDQTFPELKGALVNPENKDDS